MAIGLTDEKYYREIADAIRNKTGSTETYQPNLMAGAINLLNVPFNLVSYGIGLEQSDKLNSMFQSLIEENFNLFESKRFTANWNKIAIRNKKIFYIPFETQCTSCAEGFYESGLKALDNFNFAGITGACNSCFVGCNLDCLPSIMNFSKCTNLSQTFDLSIFKQVPEEFTLNVGYKSDVNSTVSLSQMFRYAKKVNGTINKFKIVGDRAISFQDFSWSNLLDGCEEFEYLDSINVTTLQTIFYNECIAPKRIKFGSLENCSNFSNWINNTKNIEHVEFDNWKKGSLTLFNGTNNSNNIDGASTKYIIEHAMAPEYDTDGTTILNGVTARTLTLQSIAKANFEALEDYNELVALAQTKLITIQ